MKKLALIGFVLIVSCQSALADCFCACIYGQNRPVCEHSFEEPVYICPIKLCPIY
jgi:hypothetical protein